jgi:hypothetical protein
MISKSLKINFLESITEGGICVTKAWLLHLPKSTRRAAFDIF